jgi:hypothetical protein
MVTSTMQMIEYLVPTGLKAKKKVLVPPVGTLKGKRIAFVNNGWTSFTKIGGYLTSELKDRYGVANVPMYQIPPSVAPDPKLLDRIAAESDAAVVGLAN